MSLSTYLANKLLNKILRNEELVIGVVFVSLHSGDPEKTGSNEISGRRYMRQIATFNEASEERAENDTILEFPEIPAAILTHVGLWDRPIDGNFLWGGPLFSNRITNSGDTFRIPVGNLGVSTF